MQKKRKFLDIFVFDLLFFFFVLMLIYLGMTFLTPGMSSVQQYFSQTPDPSSPNFAEEFDNMSSLANWMYVLFFIIPVLLYLGYCIFGGLSFRKEWKYVIKFSLINVLPFFFLIMAAKEIFMNVMIDFVGFVFFYLAFLLYLQPDFKKFGLRLWDWRLFAGYIGYGVLMIILMAIIVITYVVMKISIVWLALIPLGIGITALISLVKKKLIERFSL